MNYPFFILSLIAMGLCVLDARQIGVERKPKTANDVIINSLFWAVLLVVGVFI